MLVLDTNHFRELTHPTAVGNLLRRRIDRTDDAVVTCVVTAEEMLRGWLAQISRNPDVFSQSLSYLKLRDAIIMLADYTMLLWDDDCAARYHALRRQGIRIGAMDLKIACIAIEYDATLLTRDSVDFSKVPGLRFENWLD